MFEQQLKNMTALVIIESGIYATITASNVGVDSQIVKAGANEYTYKQARAAIDALDGALLSCAKYLQTRIRAKRMQFVFAFGPEMIDICGPPPKQR